MLGETDTPNDPTADQASSDKPARRRAAGRPAGPPSAALTTDIFAAPVARQKADKPNVSKAAAAPAVEMSEALAEKPAKAAAAKKVAAKTAPAKTLPAKTLPAKTLPAKKATAKKAVAKKTAPSSDSPAEETPAVAKAPIEPNGLLFQAPDATVAPPRKRVAKPVVDRADSDSSGSKSESSDNRDRDDDFDGDDDDAPRRRRRSRGGRRRRKPEDGDEPHDSNDDNDNDEDGNPTLRRRRRRRAGEDAGTSPDDPENTTVRVREARSAEDEIASVSGSTRLEAKKQRRREGREAGRRRAPIVSEAEFLARRESVKREMAVRQHTEYTQIAVLEDDVLVEHYVARESQISLIGNVYLGKVQNVLPSMEAAFVDIGKGRNAVLYAGEVDWTTLGNGKQRKIEDVLSSGQTVLVQVTKDPVGQKGARLTSQISLAGRFLVYVPGGQTSGISRKLPDTERTRLKALLKDVLPEEAGVIVRTAAEGATEDQLTRDVSALTARWDDIESKVKAGKSPDLLYAEPDLMIKVVRDLFNEDFNRLVVEGDDAWDMISGYVNHVAPDLTDRLERWNGDKDVFASLRVEEQISKALDRKVFLPSGGSLVIDRTEAMTVVDVNTGKFTGSGGNLEETVTKNNLEAAEEIVRQLRLRDIGGIIVIDFIDMVLEGNRDLVLRRLVECLGRDRTRHQVAEVTSLGLVQMTRKRIGTGLLESFSTDCDHCKGRGVVVQVEPVEPSAGDDNQRRNSRRGGGGNSGGNNSGGNNSGGNNSGGGNSGGGNSGGNNSGGGNSGGNNGGGNNGGGRKSDNNATKNDGNTGEGNDQKADEVKAPVKAADEPVNEALPTPEPEAAPKTAARPSRRRSASRSAGKPDQSTGTTDNVEVKLESSAPPKSAPEAESAPQATREAKRDVEESNRKNTEKTASVTENAVETSVTNGPVLTSEGLAP